MYLEDEHLLWAEATERLAEAPRYYRHREFNGVILETAIA